jgi:hypothetical protein
VATSEINGVVQKIRDGRPRPASSTMLTGPAVIASTARKVRIAEVGSPRSPNPPWLPSAAPDQGESFQPNGRSIAPANASRIGSSAG